MKKIIYKRTRAPHYSVYPRKRQQVSRTGKGNRIISDKGNKLNISAINHGDVEEKEKELINKEEKELVKRNE